MPCGPCCFLLPYKLRWLSLEFVITLGALRSSDGLMGRAVLGRVCWEGAEAGHLHLGGEGGLVYCFNRVFIEYTCSNPTVNPAVSSSFLPMNPPKAPQPRGLVARLLRQALSYPFLLVTLQPCAAMVAPLPYGPSPAHPVVASNLARRPSEGVRGFSGSRQSALLLRGRASAQWFADGAAGGPPCCFGNRGSPLMQTLDPPFRKPGCCGPTSGNQR